MLQKNQVYSTAELQTMKEFVNHLFVHVSEENELRVYKGNKVYVFEQLENDPNYYKLVRTNKTQ